MHHLFTMVRDSLKSKRGETHVQLARLGLSKTVRRGYLLMRSAGVAEVQTLTPSAAPASGRWRLNFGGQLTEWLNYNASAAAIKAAIERLGAFKVTHWAVTVSGALSTSPTITWGQKESVATFVVESEVKDGGGADVTVAVAKTTPGYAAGTLAEYVNDRLAAPAKPTIAKKDATAGTFTAVPHRAKVAYLTARGESALSEPSDAVTPTADKSIELSAIAAIPSGVTKVVVYVSIDSGDFIRSAEVNVASNATAAATISAPPVGTGARHPGDTTRTASVVGIAPCDLASDSSGGIIYGSTTVSEWGRRDQTFPMLIGGIYDVSSIPNLDADALNDLRGRVLLGMSLGDAEAEVLIPGIGAA